MANQIESRFFLLGVADFDHKTPSFVAAKHLFGDGSGYLIARCSLCCRYSLALPFGVVYSRRENPAIISHPELTAGNETWKKLFLNLDFYVSFLGLKVMRLLFFAR